jgi:1-phosphofructokinase family hexose kinase
MFLCLSLNPAVDKRLKMDVLQVGKVNRACQAQEGPGGKAAHVAMVLRTLGAAPLWLGFAGGTTGAVLVEGLQQLGIRAEAVPMRGNTRTNLEILESGQRVTEILEPGPEISAGDLEEFQATYERILAGAGSMVTVILSGSLPPGVPHDYYASLIRSARKFRTQIFLDASGEPLRSGLTAGPDFVKPNQEEAESWSGRSIGGIHPAREVLNQMMEKGAAAGAISLGSEGLVWGSRTERETLAARIPKQSSPSCVGSGDATLAGFAFAAENGWSPKESVRIAAACGVANCIADGPGRALAADIAHFKQEIQIETLP